MKMNQDFFNEMKTIFLLQNYYKIKQIKRIFFQHNECFLFNRQNIIPRVRPEPKINWKKQRNVVANYL